MSETSKTGYEVQIQGLTREELEALTERVKSAVVLVLPERVRLDQVMVQPIFDND